MDVQTAPRAVLSPAQARLALGMRHTTMANLRSIQGECAYPVVSLHYDMVETAATCLRIDGPAKEAFTRLAGLPNELVTDALK